MADTVAKLRKRQGSQLPSRADFGINLDVRYWHKADITVTLSNVRFWG
jgi:hypothetical protein